jgi:hypothetical protein
MLRHRFAPEEKPGVRFVEHFEAAVRGFDRRFSLASSSSRRARASTSFLSPLL